MFGPSQHRTIGVSAAAASTCSIGTVPRYATYSEGTTSSSTISFLTWEYSPSAPITASAM